LDLTRLYIVYGTYIILVVLCLVISMYFLNLETQPQFSQVIAVRKRKEFDMSVIDGAEINAI
jgi:hypothetical protein